MFIDICLYTYVYLCTYTHTRICTNITVNNKANGATVSHSNVLLISQINWPADYPPTALEAESVGHCGAAREQQRASNKELLSPNKQDVERHWILGLREPPPSPPTRPPTTYCETRPAAPFMSRDDSATAGRRRRERLETRRVPSPANSKEWTGAAEDFNWAAPSPSCDPFPPLTLPLL